MRRVVFFLVLLMISAPRLSALGKPEFELELDPYYSDVAMTIPFSTGVAAGMVEGEFKTYSAMTKHVLLPQFVILEGSVNPLPVAGAFFRHHGESVYRRARVTPSLNLVEALTTGFEEPYALSLFLGNIIDFSHGQKSRGHKRKGYMGYLVSVGNYHIMESLLIPDNWVEAEVKIKGDQVTEERKMSWSFRAGQKAHGNRDISDTIYFGLRRDRIDYVKTPLSFWLSAGLDYRADFRRSDLRPVSHSVMVEKNFPFTTASKKKLTFSLGFGYQWLSREKYAGALAERRLRPESRIMIRPNLKF